MQHTATCEDRVEPASEHNGCKSATPCTGGSDTNNHIRQIAVRCRIEQLAVLTVSHSVGQESSIRMLYVYFKV